MGASGPPPQRLRKYTTGTFLAFSANQCIDINNLWLSLMSALEDELRRWLCIFVNYI